MGIALGPCSPGARHGSWCSGEKRKVETEINEKGGVYRTFRGIAFGRAYKEMREIAAKHVSPIAISSL